VAQVLGGVLCGVLVVSAVSPSWAQGERGGERATPVVGDFALGDALEGAIDPRDGSFGLTMHVGGLAVRWDSRAVGADPHGLGAGLAWDLGRIETVGGVRVRPSSSNDVFPADASQASGLAGYGVHDVVFDQVDGVLPPGDGREPVDYRFVLHELGGMDAYFDAQGEPVARLDVFGAREEWRWDPLVPHRLVEHVDTDGVATELDWESEPGALIVRPAANVATPPAGEDDPDAGARGAVWRVELDGGRAAAFVDPVGGRTRLEFDESTGLLAAVGGPAGGVTRVAWRVGADAVPRVERVVTTDASGAELSAREWRSVGETLPSGWPVYAGDGEVFRSGDPAFRARTVTTDGATSVVSEYNALHTLVGRRMVAATPSGERELQEHAFTYPGTEDGGVPDPAALPANWSRPTVAEVTHRDALGGSRSTVETTAFDDVGRLVARTSADGTETTTEYDPVVPAGRDLPIGLAVSETVTSPDGEARVTSHTLDAARSSVLATEVTSVPADPAVAPLVVARTEFEAAPDGRVIERRAYPGGDRDAEPTVTRWDESFDLATGTRTATETIAVGTAAEATVTEVGSLITGQVIATTDPLGNIGGVRHDRLGRAIEATDASGRTTTARYETAQADGRNATTVRTPDGVERTKIRDELGRTIRSADNIDRGRAVDGHVRVAETREYPEPGVTTVTDAWGATTTTREDVFGRPVETVSPTGLVQLTLHDDVANTVTTALTPTGALADAELVSTQRQDEAGRAVEATGTRADGEPVSTARSSYDGFGRPLRMEDGSIAETHQYDGYGRQVRTAREPIARDEGRASWPEPSPGRTDPGEPIVADRRFDAHGNGVEKILSDATSSRSGGSRTVDPLGRTVATTDQLGRVSTIEYAADGLVSSTTTGAGQRTELRYDDVRRVLLGATVDSPIGAPVRLEFEVDPVTDAVLAVFDPEDRAGTVITSEFDAWGNPTLVTYPDGRRMRAQFDEHGRRIGGVDVAGNVTRLDYAPDGRLTGAAQRGAAGELLAEVAYRYDAYARVETIDRGNGVRTEFTFTSASEIAGESTEHDGVPQTQRSYAYDVDGRLVRRTDTDWTGDAAASVTTVYGYDAHGRLVRSAEYAGADERAPATMRTTYELSASNDVRVETVVTRPGAADESSVRREFEYSPLGELIAITTTNRPTARDDDADGDGDGDGDRDGTGVSDEVRRDVQRYDGAGNLVAAADGSSYAYDAVNRPITEIHPDGATAAIEYWADGTRRSLTRQAGSHGRPTVTTFYWDGDALLNDVHAGTEAGIATHLIGSARHARTVVEAGVEGGVEAGGAPVTAYFVTDRHGSVTELTGPDGAVKDRYRYSDYGVPLAEHDWSGLHGNPFGYAGEFTHESGTQHLSTRTYDPWAMRFTTLDTAELHNLYAYADANPITRVDPSGRAGIEDVGHWALALFGVAVGVISAVSMAMTAGATMAVFGMAVATAFDALVTVANTVNEQHVEFMPTSVGFILGLAATAGALLTAKWVTGGARITGVKRGPEIEMDEFAAIVRRELQSTDTGDAPSWLTGFSDGVRIAQHDRAMESLWIRHAVSQYHVNVLVEILTADPTSPLALARAKYGWFVWEWEALGIKIARFSLQMEAREARMNAISVSGLWVELTRSQYDGAGQLVRIGLPFEIVRYIRDRALLTPADIVFTHKPAKKMLSIGQRSVQYIADEVSASQTLAEVGTHHDATMIANRFATRKAEVKRRDALTFRYH
jgi:RHS repeat-associated protein